LKRPASSRHSSTAEPKPPANACSSMVTMSPTRAARVRIHFLSKGLQNRALTTVARTPSWASIRAASSAGITIDRIDARLRDQLATRGINAELHNDNRALKVIKPEPGLPVWVFVGYGGAYYSWQSAEKRHPIDDVDGAAKVLAAYVAR